MNSDCSNHSSNCSIRLLSAIIVTLALLAASITHRPDKVLVFSGLSMVGVFLFLLSFAKCDSTHDEAVQEEAAQEEDIATLTLRRIAPEDELHLNITRGFFATHPQHGHILVIQLAGSDVWNFLNLHLVSVAFFLATGKYKLIASKRLSVGSKAISEPFVLMPDPPPKYLIDWVRGA